MPDGDDPMRVLSCMIGLVLVPPELPVELSGE
jgi:hypothetical protein